MRLGENLNSSYARLVFYASTAIILVVLDAFTNLDHKITMALAIILAFLILLTYIFKVQGPKSLKIFTIVFAYLGLPLFMLWYLGIFDYFSNPFGGIVMVIITTIMGILAIFTIIRLNYIEIEYVEE